LGSELDSDLFTLCEYHHTRLHELYKLKKRKKRYLTLLVFTRSYIKKQRQSKPKQLQPLRQQEQKPNNFDKMLKQLAKDNRKPKLQTTKQPKFKSKNQFLLEEIRRKKAERKARRKAKRYLVS